MAQAKPPKPSSTFKRAIVVFSNREPRWMEPLCQRNGKTTADKCSERERWKTAPKWFNGESELLDEFQESLAKDLW